MVDMSTEPMRKHWELINPRRAPSWKDCSWCSPLLPCYGACSAHREDEKRGNRVQCGAVVPVVEISHLRPKATSVGSYIWSRINEKIEA